MTPGIKSLYSLTIDGVQLPAAGSVLQPLGVVHFALHEGLSRLFSLEVEFASAKLKLPKPEAPLGSSAVFRIMDDAGAGSYSRCVHGIVSRFEQIGSTRKFEIYRAQIVPWVWRLLHRRDCRIFQEMTVQEIVTEVLRSSGLATDAFEFKVQGNYLPRTYCVQYRESDWTFISRLLEEEGIFYYFDHTSEEDHVLVMSDHIPNPSLIPPPAVLPFSPPSGLVPNRAAIHEWSVSRHIATGKVTLRDFDFAKPTQDLEAVAEAKVDQDLESYDYPGAYGVLDEGKRRASVRLEEQQAFGMVGRGSSACHRMIPGRHFDIVGHPYHPKGSWLLVSVDHSGAQPQVLGEDAPSGDATYSNGFTAIPATTSFRPSRVTPKPVMRGLQTAVVVGPAGEEVYVDEHGRVKVQFHWDRLGSRDENSSCWIRVSQLWAGQSWGAMWIPRIGHEVIVDFLDGDPDRPIITGRVYNGDNQPPYALPKEKTKSTIKSESSKGGGGFNELRFEDLKGKEEVFLQAQKDWNIKVLNDKGQSVGHDETLSVGNDRTKTVERDQTVHINGKSTTVIKMDSATEVTEGNQSITVSKGNRTLEVTKGDNQIDVAAGNYNLSAAKEATVDADKVKVTAQTEVELTVGSNTIKITKQGITINGVKIDTSSTGPTTMSGAMINLN